MLATDKQLLLSQLKQNTTTLKQKEFNLHHSNMMTVGTQSAVLAGLDVVMFIEFAPPPDSMWAADMQWVPRLLKFVYFVIIISAFCCNMIVVAHTTSLSVLAGSLALRGPEGSMVAATDGLYQERDKVYRVFGAGLALTVGSCVLGVWILLDWEAALLTMSVALGTCVMLYRKYRSFVRRFDFNKKDTVHFDDMLIDSPVGVSSDRWKSGRQNGESSRSNYSTKHSAKHSPESNHHKNWNPENVELIERGVTRRRASSPQPKESRSMMLV